MKIHKSKYFRHDFLKLKMKYFPCKDIDGVFKVDHI